MCAQDSTYRDCDGGADWTEEAKAEIKTEVEAIGCAGAVQAGAATVLLVGVAVKLSSLFSHCFVIAGRLTAVSVQAANHLLN